MARAYKITEVCGDWALHIPPYGKTDAEMILIFNSRNNAELVKSVLEWEDAHPNAAVPYKSTLTPPNEPLTLDELRKGYNTPVWLSWYGDVQEWAFVRPYSKTHLEVLVFDGEADLVRIDEYRRSWVVYRRPPEGEA